MKEKTVVGMWEEESQNVKFLRDIPDRVTSHLPDQRKRNVRSLRCSPRRDKTYSPIFQEKFLWALVFEMHSCRCSMESTSATTTTTVHRSQTFCVVYIVQEVSDTHVWHFIVDDAPFDEFNSVENIMDAVKKRHKGKIYNAIILLRYINISPTRFLHVEDSRH